MVRTALFRLLLSTALLLAVPAFAAGKPDPKTPVPGKAPTRVPFSAFRTKPILDMHSEEGNLKSKGKKPIKIKIQPKPKPVAAIPPEAVSEPVIEAREERDENEAPPSVQIIGGKPVPARKPGVATADDIIGGPATANNRGGEGQEQDAASRQVSPEETTDPATAAAEAEVEADTVITPFAPPPKPNLLENALNIREERDFDDNDDRTAGSGFGRRRGKALDVASFGARDLRAMLQPDANGDISPVLLPGNDEVVAAPDAPGEDQSGVPAQVIVFFQEDSPKMEVGQLDVVNTDVVEQLHERPELNLEIVGFSESLGEGNDATRKMAATRAAELRDYLKTQKIDGDRLTVTAKGDDTEIEPRDRVEMHFTQ